MNDCEARDVFRKKIFEMVNLSEKNLRITKIYHIVVMFFILLSLAPLAVRKTNAVLETVDRICFIFFVIDYMLRLLTADYAYEKKSVLSFLRYVLSFSAIVNVLSVLPLVIESYCQFELLRMLKFVQSIQILLLFNKMPCFRSLKTIVNVFKKSKNMLIATYGAALVYIIVSALVIFNIEPESFNTFFDAIYWSTVSLTTIGYGDIYPLTYAGKFITVLSSMFGIAIVALPTGIITAKFMKENKMKENQAEKRASEDDKQ